MVASSVVKISLLNAFEENFAPEYPGFSNTGGPRAPLGRHFQIGLEGFVYKA